MDFFDSVKDKKILVIGAGGIGCELLKTLGMTGFKDIEVLDLDTIDISNLNRQFLFTKKDVGKYKAEIAASSITERFPEIKIKAHVGNIKSKEYDSGFYKKFDLIFNALDNIEARKHVNRMWVSYDKPLIDGGSTGFIGTTVSIVKGKTPCYECIPKPTPKQFPVWTIRSTPEKMIHCVVWAKYLLSALFGSSEQVNFLEEIKNDLGELVKKGDSIELAKVVFQRVFEQDIKDQINMREKRDEEKSEENKKILKNLKERVLHPIPAEKIVKINEKASILSSEGDRKDTEIWSQEQYILLFQQSITEIFSKHKENIGQIEFDKDDNTLLNFIISASNLRADNYLIQKESCFKIKEIAGNIVPAISSTNGLVAGLEVIEGMKCLSGKINDLKAVSFSSKNIGRVITGSNITKEINPEWDVCSDISLMIKLSIDPETFTLSDLITKVLSEELTIFAPSIETGGNIIYECGDDQTEEEVAENKAKVKKLLKEIGIENKSKLYVDDYIQDFNCYVEIQFSTEISKDEDNFPKGFGLEFLNGARKVAKKVEEEVKIVVEKEKGSSTSIGGEVEIDVDEKKGDVICIESEGFDESLFHKRLLGNLEEIETESKRLNKGEEKLPEKVD